MQSDRALPGDAHLLRMWKNCEHGKHRPRLEYQRLIATAFGTVAAAIFGPDASVLARPPEPELVIADADNTLELVERIRRSDLDRASLDTLSITVQRLCSEYAFMPSVEARRWWAERGLALYGNNAAREDAVEDLLKRRNRALAQLEAPRKEPKPKASAAMIPVAVAEWSDVAVAPATSVHGEIEILVCNRCGGSFERVRFRGRKPLLCPGCRTQASDV